LRAAQTTLVIGLISLLVGVGRDVTAIHDTSIRVPPAIRPDILLVTIDALRADHVSAGGYRRLTTPAIDAFMASATRFTTAIAQAPYTKASVASLMTGLYPSTHQTVTTSVPFPETMSGHVITRPVLTDVLPSSTPTLSSMLRHAGYRTVGFTANPFLIDAFGFDQGFDVFRFYPGPDFAGADRLVADAIDAARETDVSKPLFVWVHMMEPHSPYTPPPLTRGMFKVDGPPEPIPRDLPIPSWLLPGTPRDRRLYVEAYDEEIAAADAAFDTLVREVRSVRQGRESVIAVTSDHGEQFLDHGGWEHSSTLYDELIHVPLGLEIPQGTARVVDAQVQLIDLFPTLLELGHADIPPNAGRSLGELLRGSGRGAPAVSEIVGAQYALRDGEFKLIETSDGREQLFDLAADPSEQHDLSSVDRARAIRMRNELHVRLARSLEEGRVVHHECRHPSIPRLSND
jgi:arylsulfatase A-like enzyme